MNRFPTTLFPLITCGALATLLSACAVSPETQALIDEYERTIPSCNSQADCDSKWAAARSWALENADFPIYSESATRIRATSTLTTNSGVGVVVRREGGPNQYQFYVDVECFTVYGCPGIWETKIDFNRRLNGS